jgi:hypothetical protein
MIYAPLPQPTPKEVRAARKAAGLTQTGAAQVIGQAGAKGYRTWQRFEYAADNKDHRAINPKLWELFLLLTDQHPTLRLIRRRGRPPEIRSLK